MNRSLLLLWGVMAAWGLSTAYTQTAVAPAASKSSGERTSVSPPPFIKLPNQGQPPPVNAALRRKIDGAHAGWKKNDGGAEFNSGITYSRDGQPTLMLITDQNEPKEKQSRRQKAIVTACEFLLDDEAFEGGRVCIVSLDPKNPSAQTTRNYEVQRAKFQTAAKKAGKSDKLKDALKKARDDDHAAKLICADLEIE